MKEPFRQFIKSKIEGGFLLISCGLPGTGKTGTTEVAHQVKGGTLLKSDIIRREVLKGQDIFSPEVAGDESKRARVYDEMFRQADAALAAEPNVILDATFITQSLRRRAAGIAAGHGAALIILETVCPEDICLARILARDKATSVSNAVTEEAYLSNKDRFEAIDLDDLKKRYPALKLVYLAVDTSKASPEAWQVTKYEER
ncbi:MAG: ATP-binding protein [Dehalococcoidales bacterium]|jgi:hypothetical protein